jgi:UDP-glucose 6-dehydrogenase
MDAYAILTEWKEFKNLDIELEKVFDGRNIFKNSYYSIGR